jgi:hypothetical protein
MTVDHWRSISWVAAGVAITAILLSLIWHIPYLYTLIGAAIWAFIGHIITADDDAPGGWSNPDGSLPFPWRELAVKAAFLAGLIALAVLFPSLRAAGGG